ncbi:c-type cytochrome [Schlesneria paludicola]|uniref:c-type cytochrome n=1 Tax=Schlesneria paludicola TaxID=360056 RepID=UPI00029AF151|nr:cytochrome c [Schlesneria paludicola]
MTRRCNVRDWCFRVVGALRWHSGRPMLAIGAITVALISGCDRLDMYDQPRYEPYEASTFFGDGLSARPPVVGTIPRGGLRDNIAYYTGRGDSTFVSAIPEEAYRELHSRFPLRFPRSYDNTSVEDRRLGLLERGQNRFNIHCAVCHGRTGVGDGMIVQRGFRRPPSYHDERLRNAAAGHFFDVMTSGFGAMSSYSSRVDVVDRWAIVAYIRALQFSQLVELEELPLKFKESFDNLTSDDAVPIPRQEGAP